MFKQEKIGIIGMGVMGRNLALNIESKGYCVVVYNRSKNKTDAIVANNSKKNIIPCYSIEEFVLSLNKPRFIFLMITSGTYIDSIIKILSPYMNPGDVLIDGGNSFYKDTMRRNLELSKKGIHFIGTGISGGEEGALKGPSIMPGGHINAYKMVESVFKKIAARVDDETCVAYIGPNGSGHYLKMIHNGIEYGDMQIIAEIYFFLQKIFHLTYEELGEIFNQWNQGELNSYLIEITSYICVKKNANNDHILNSILDVAGNKSTGAWTSQDAIDLGIPLGMITESVFARYMSVLKKQRLKASKILSGPNIKNCCESRCLYLEKARKALYLGKIILYAQGFYQLRIASDKYHWDLNYKQIAQIFRAGCIIRSKFLKKIIDIYSQTPDINNLLLSPYCSTIANDYQQMLRDIVMCAIKYGIPMPALSTAIAYYDSYRSNILPANLIQAQRDYFGAHTYMCFDKQGTFHTDWLR
ncbi:decarboxylating NADP(+)-dependent phosphogluconate dehydrogenase [Blochmannia endosymbiont of Camponotus sp. C-046]|uniref:decarboxylating NADP(+)-dependent phosphogluconate dehydrogenase n=1 Tax=Blochmannia endosymbiont of Camponotus sp. C-046 TaxID=2945589 RepID=UPI002024DFF2|nr:decarboxylating NADP(+)-dependent phosphogluconate dehydrogenase [Blochmannia endosymbiont of Camponotus sp. C-046]URJ28833.1 decarboxylating NADP(+)-dependent phosphogluconate dehydrogenase [Blochmannia endosymbiont of Camponotus sp. C-046]